MWATGIPSGQKLKINYLYLKDLCQVNKVNKENKVNKGFK